MMISTSTLEEHEAYLVTRIALLARDHNEIARSVKTTSLTMRKARCREIRYALDELRRSRSERSQPESRRSPRAGHTRGQCGAPPHHPLTDTPMVPGEPKRPNPV